MNLKSKFLIIAPHPDDEILACGGLINKIALAGGSVYILTICNHLPPLYSKEAANITINEMKKCHNFLKVKKSINFGYPACLLFKKEQYLLNNEILNITQKIKANYIFLPFPDRHQDHKIVFESSMVATRPKKKNNFIKQIYLYETISETFWNAPQIEPNFIPDTFIDITKNIKNKVKALKYFKSQINENDYERSLRAIEALSIFRGSQVGFKFAESFKLIRSRID